MAGSPRTGKRRTTLTKTTYDHGDNLDFTGGEIDAIFTNSSGEQIREEISIPTGLGNQTIETNTTTADVNKNPVKLTYEGYTIDLPLTINDPLDHITVNPPTKITYEHGDNISFAGGSITTHTKSGATAIIPATDAGITIEPTTADINTVINSWTTPSGLTAGTEEITVKYQGKSEVIRERMQVMTKTNDGFIISEKDLELRGSGEFFGTKQHGIPEFKIANLFEDMPMLKEVQELAEKILADDQKLEKEENKKLKRIVDTKLKINI